MAPDLHNSLKCCSYSCASFIGSQKDDIRGVLDNCHSSPDSHLREVWAFLDLHHPHLHHSSGRQLCWLPAVAAEPQGWRRPCGEIAELMCGITWEQFSLVADHLMCCMLMARLRCGGRQSPFS
eukprot:scaffold41199_cov22-Tisochrysis_lutea.AAC.4